MKYQKTKTLVTKPNNNSADCIAPNLVYGCFGNCKSYCYMARYNGDRVFINENVNEIFDSVANWVENKPWPKIANQQDPVYYMADISCNTDLSLMQKHLAENLYDYLKRYDNHSKLNSTMATKYSGLLTLDVSSFNKKPRVRVSLMPQDYSNILEPKMQKISDRIEDINRLKKLGWEVHINFSPVIFYKDWQKQYYDLFKEVKLKAGINKCEVIALTNHKNQMTNATFEAQELMKDSNEVKNATGVMRYPLTQKKQLINQFKNIYKEFFPLETIRYIF